jgi:hypothetical protein
LRFIHTGGYCRRRLEHSPDQPDPEAACGGDPSDHPDPIPHEESIGRQDQAQTGKNSQGGVHYQRSDRDPLKHGRTSPSADPAPEPRGAATAIEPGQGLFRFRWGQQGDRDQHRK